MNERETILLKLEKDFPEIFVNGDISLNKAQEVIYSLSPIFEQPVERIVLFEKKGYVAGRRGKLIRLLNKLNPNY